MLVFLGHALFCNGKLCCNNNLPLSYGFTFRHRSRSRETRHRTASKERKTEQVAKERQIRKARRREIKIKKMVRDHNCVIIVMRIIIVTVYIAQSPVTAWAQRVYRHVKNIQYNITARGSQ